MKAKNLAAKIVLLTTLIAHVQPLAISKAGGIPVFDGVNLTQNIMSALEAVAQTAKQIQEYQIQLQQYANQLQNTMAPASYTWDQAQTTINALVTATDTLDYYKTRLGNIGIYLNEFQDLNYYTSSPCFTSGGCSAAQRATLLRNRDLSSESQKKANDALFLGLDQQQTNLRNDAVRLRSLQSAAQGATGQMAAIQYANQFASQQANQLLQIRGLLIAQQNAEASRMQAVANLEAQENAASLQLRQGNYRTSPLVSW